MMIFQAWCLKGNKNQCFKDEIKQILPYFQVEYEWLFEVRKGLSNSIFFLWHVFFWRGSHECVGMNIEKE